MRRLAPLLLLAACSDSPSNPPVDATADVGGGPGPAVCLVPATYGDLGARTGAATTGIATSISVTIDDGPPRDAFFVNLRTGNGVFGSGIMTGTYTLAGAELDSATCGLCVNIIADIVSGQGPSKFYFATGGSVTLTGTEPATGSLSNVTFHEVTVNGQPTGSGCTTGITSMSFGPPPPT